MKILIIGGTEFFGQLLVVKLLKAGHELTLLTRGNKKPKAFWQQISHIQCDRTNYSDFHKKLSNKTFDVVIDNAVFTKADIESVINVFSTHSKLPQYICCSSVAVYDNWFDCSNGFKPFKEQDATLKIQRSDNWEIQYADGKRAAERYLQAHHGAMPYTILRPTVIEGPGDPYKRTWFWMQRLQDGQPIILSTEDKKTLYRHVLAEDVAHAFFLAVGNPKAYNQAYNVAGEEVVSIKEYLQVMANAMQQSQSNIPLCWIPSSALKAVLPYYCLPAFFEKIRLVPSIDKAKQELGYQPHPLSVWMKETVEAFKNELSLSWGYEHRKEEIKLAKQIIK